MDWVCWALLKGSCPHHLIFPTRLFFKKIRKVEPRTQISDASMESFRFRFMWVSMSKTFLEGPRWGILKESISGEPQGKSSLIRSCWRWPFGEIVEMSVKAASESSFPKQHSQRFMYVPFFPLQNPLGHKQLWRECDSKFTNPENSTLLRLLKYLHINPFFSSARSLTSAFFQGPWKRSPSSKRMFYILFSLNLYKAITLATEYS